MIRYAEMDVLFTKGMYGHLLSERGCVQPLKDPVITLLIASPGGTRKLSGGYWNVAMKAKTVIF